jgi:hypothetical protein
MAFSEFSKISDRGSNVVNVLPRDLAGAVSHVSVDPTLVSCALQDALRAAIATGRGLAGGTSIVPAGS